MGKFRFTDENYKYFQERCLYWINKFGLTGWKVCFHQIDDDEEDGIASIYADMESRNVAIELNMAGDDHETTDDLIDKIALHEVCHLLLKRFRHICQDRSNEYLEEAEHEIVHSIVNTIKNLL